MDLPRRLRRQAGTRSSPDFEIHRQERKKTSQNSVTRKEDIKESLTTLMLKVAEKGDGKRHRSAEYRINREEARRRQHEDPDR